MLKKLINIGIHDGLTFKAQSKIRIFITSSLIVAGISIIFSILRFLKGDFSASIISIFQFAYYAFFSILLIHRRKYLLSYHLSISAGMCFIFLFSMLYGESMQTHIFFFFMPMAAVILFDNFNTILAYSFLAISLLIIAKISFDYYTPFYPHNSTNAILGTANLFFTAILIFLGVKQFKTENITFTEKINFQNQLLEEKNKDITDSINYAKRIQKTLLASDSFLTKNLPEHFVVYKPKDIVSGDFYWAATPYLPGKEREAQSIFMLCVGDCTGHGVPGAFMSLLGVSYLNEIVMGRKIIRADEVLNQLRNEIIKAMNPEGMEEGKDGMDAALCSIDFEKKEMHFACANNPVWIIRGGKLNEFEPDNFPIGKYSGEIKPFTLHSAKLEKGDMIYLCTDGYADQFGGPKGKKFKSKQLKEKLLSISSNHLTEQKNILEKTFDDWKNELEQLDDILVIGIRV